MNKLHKVAAWALTLLALVSLLAPALAAGGSGTVQVQTVEDLIALSKNCALDRWSQGKTVVLKADLDLTGSEFAPIPTFSGTFDGQGHTITGLSITGSGNVRGLFRYIQAGGVVQNLTLEGSIAPEDRQDSLGLVAGSNRGRIVGCTARGTVQGKNQVGGIAGVNQEGGEIVNCSFSGTLTGEHSAGGIVGENLGTLTQCQNSASVNTSGLEDTLEVGDVDWNKPNSTTNVPEYTDIGGVAGLSSGVLQNCQNTGPVGYAHIGYNVGGVAGRQSGYLDGCTNSGTIQGRKDVGGIVGQLEPEVVRRFSEDYLEQLLDECDTLLDLMDRTLSHTDNTASALSTQLHTLSDKARTAKDVTGDLMDAMTDWTNGSIDQVNELSARMAWTLNQMEPILDDAVVTLETMEEATDQMDDVLDEMETAADQMGKAMDGVYDGLDQGRDALQEMRKGLDNLQSSMDHFSSASKSIRQAMSDLGGALGNETALADALRNLSAAMSQFQSAFDAMKRSLQHISDTLVILDEMGETLLDAMDLSSDAMDTLRDAVDLLRTAGDTVDAALSGLTSMAGSLRDMVAELADMPTIAIDPIGPDITQQGDALDDAMSALLDEGDALNDLMRTSTDTMIADLRAISAQFRVILALTRQEKADKEEDWGDSLEDQIRNRFQDVSDQGSVTAQHNGRISASRNEGGVAGDINTGGIAGSLSIEYDFDPEDDLKKVGDYSLDFTYNTKALLLSCVNTGAVEGKRDYVGGIVGRMDMGLVSTCEGYGQVASDDGSYVGGIAGAAYSAIQDSWAKCTLSGTDYIGGVAGLGSTLTNCHTLVRIAESGAYQGAIVGDLDDDPSVVLSGNTFTSDELHGWDGISYSGKAEPVSFDALFTTHGAPTGFTNLELTFVAGGKTVEVVPFQYGQGLKSLPEIPAKKGYFAAWPDIDYTHLTASETLEAVYTPYRSVLSEGGDFPDILVDGTFSGQAQVTHTTQEVSWTDPNGKTYTAIAYTVTVDDPDLKSVSCTVHYRIPEGMNGCVLWVETPDGWKEQDYTIDGSYLLLHCDETPVTFCVTEGGANWLLLGGGIVVILALVGAVMFRKHRKRPAPVGSMADGSSDS